ncbi:hypothetical protein PITCH_A1330020 [uncultured Desulfobacterium sp.]|uniref:Sigma-54 factor interaction domain-containing protein n=1 Tax=uncultured Desulfobacterium sp. TaxID=201089 RepID=A0A445MSG5_9BACT|nr:hypothetical protein PITCH_A1330020 [uncultured Desulfobacterium sp.]
MTDNLALRLELAMHFEHVKERIVAQWIHAMKAEGFFDKLSDEEKQKEPEKMYNIFLEYFRSDSKEKINDYAKSMIRKVVLEQLTSTQIVIMFHALRDLLGRAAFDKYNKNPDRYITMMEVYEPIINELLRMAYEIFINERDKIIKQKRDALYESEALSYTLMENIADGIVLLDMDRIVFINPAFVFLFGYSDKNQLVGTSMTRLIAQDFHDDFKKVTDSFAKGIIKEKTLRCRCIKHDGRQFWLEVHAVCTTWEEKTAMLATVVDITENVSQKRAEKEQFNQLRNENKRLKATIGERYKFCDIIGKSLVMNDVYEHILKAASANVPVIIYGETGTGKELVARAIHQISNHCDRAFVPVNCAAIPSPLFEREFFGHKRGSFTGAESNAIGYLSMANGGTLFMDEIGEIDINMQAKLLRAFESGEYLPVGSTKAEQSDFCIISATNRNLLDLAKKGLMRKDFFFRIHVFPIRLPPLRKRKEDIPLLVEHFCKSFNNGSKNKMVPPKIIEAFYGYDWPGNVRELQNVVHRYLISGDLSFLEELTMTDDNKNDSSYGNGFDHGGLTIRPAVEDLEGTLIFRALDKTFWNRSDAARLLGISRKTLYRKINKGVAEIATKKHKTQ